MSPIIIYKIYDIAQRQPKRLPTCYYCYSYCYYCYYYYYTLHNSGSISIVINIFINNVLLYVIEYMVRGLVYTPFFQKRKQQQMTE